MATQTETLMAGAVAEEYDRHDDASMEVIFQDDRNLTSKVSLLDSVVSGFFDSNMHRGKRYSLDDLLTHSTYYPRYFGYQHLSIPYLGTVFTVAGKDYDWVNLELANNGFEYHNCSFGVEISRHNGTNWTSLNPTQALEWFPGLVAASKPHFKSACVFYNYSQQRLDIKLYPKKGSKAMLITFERGYPDRQTDRQTDRNCLPELGHCLWQ